MGYCPPCYSEMVSKIAELLCGGRNQNKSIEKQKWGTSNNKKIRGTVVLMKKNVLDISDLGSSFLDRVHELLGRGVSLQLISAVHGDSGQPLELIFYTHNNV